MNNKVDIRIKAKAQNAILAKFADACGGVEAAACELGVCTGTFSSWLNFRSRFNPARMKIERAKEVIRKLEKATGKPIREIFQLSKAEMAVLKKERVYTRSVDVARLSNYRSTYYLEDLDSFDLKEHVDEALQNLTEKEREIITKRFGLNGSPSLTQAEVSDEMGITKSRVSQLERRAIAKLQLPENCRVLSGHLD